MKDIKEFCKFIGITEDQLGGSLYLRGTGITSLPDNLTVGGNLDLSGTGITSLPDNLTVGSSLYLEGTGITSQYKKLPAGYVFTWQNGRYIKCDDIFTEVISHRSNVYHVRKIGSKEIIYLVTDGNGKWSHGSTLKEAKEDLIYKVSNRTKDDYAGMKLANTLSFEDAVTCYRVITGACSFGTKDFVKNRLDKKKSKYSISEIIKVTKGEWGNKSFANFFKK